MLKFIVIGLGSFGMSLAKTLFDDGMEVVAIDRDPGLVQRARDCSSEAIVADIMDKDIYQSIGVKEAEAVIVSISTNLEASVLAVHYMKEFGVKRIIAKANSEDHRKLLEKLGASEVVFPERDMGMKLAKGLTNPNMLEHIPLTPGYSIAEIAPGSDLTGRTLIESRLRNKYKVQVVAIRDVLTDTISVIPEPDFTIKDSDLLIVMGRNDDIDRLKNLR